MVTGADNYKSIGDTKIHVLYIFLWQIINMKFQSKLLRYILNLFCNYIIIILYFTWNNLLTIHEMNVLNKTESLFHRCLLTPAYVSLRMTTSSGRKRVRKQRYILNITMWNEEKHFRSLLFGYFKVKLFVIYLFRKNSILAFQVQLG